MTRICVLVLLGFSAASTAAPIAVDHRKQLFLDDYLIASMNNVQRRIQPAEKHPANPVIWAEEAWEEKLVTLYGSVIRDQGRYKAWYKCGGGIAYAESDDGITWSKPPLDVVLVDGRKTNVLLRKTGKFNGAEGYPYFYELFGVHKDVKDPDPSRRYKMGFLNIETGYKGPGGDPFHPGQRRGLGVAGSPDGIHWKLIDNWATEAICDGATHWMFDPARDRYVLYGRTRKTLPEVEAAWSKYDWYKDWHSGRAVARVESPDFLTWDFTRPASAPVVLTADLGDKPGTEIYSMKVFPYESVYIGLVQVYMALPDESTLDVQLAVSRDSVHFTRVGDRSPFIPLGGVGSWDRFNLSLANNDPHPDGDRLRFYYGGRMYRHTPYKGPDTGPTRSGIGFATIRKDRFVALQASFDGGQIVTRPLLLTGRTLRLNAQANFGEIIVEVLDDAGKTLARSEEIRVDNLDIPVAWRDGGFPPDGRPVQLRITLKNALLFAIWCT
ncbi:MAG: hypothetical protein HRF43_19675 [Phycisphaerae bacterium]